MRRYIMVAAFFAALGLVAGRLIAPSAVPATHHSAAPMVDAIEVDASDERPAPRMGECDLNELGRLRERVDQMSAKLALQDVLLEGLSAQNHGEEIEWPAVVSPALDPDNFDGIVTQAIAKKESPLRFVGPDCAEPPCVAILTLEAPASEAGAKDVIDAAANLLGSTVWTENLGKEVALSHFEPFDCDGQIEWMLLVAPQLSGDSLDRDNVDKRLNYRAAQILEQKDCESIDVQSFLGR